MAAMSSEPRPLEGVQVHPRALVETGEVGAGTRVWAFAHLAPGSRVGRDCNVCDHTFVEGGVVVGDRVTIKSGIYLWDGVTVEDDVFLGPNVVFTNDLYPRSRRRPEAWTPTLVRAGASVGANATLVAGITVGRYAMVGAGAVVTRDVPDFGLVIGNPARLAGHVGRAGRPLVVDGERGTCPETGEVYLLRDGRCVPADEARP